MDFLSRIQGGIFGVAIGDALGVPIEFRKRNTFEKVTDFQYCQTFKLNPGEWSDDTSMTLCLAHSLITQKGFNLKNQTEQYIKWFLDGFMSHNGKAIGIGYTTLLSLTLYIKTKKIYTILTDEKYSGNGSLMRVLPVILFFAHDIEKAVYYSGESSKNTHGSQIAIDACRYFAYIICKIIHGTTKEEIKSKEFKQQTIDFFNKKPLHKKVEKIIEGEYFEKNTDEIKSTGYVVDTLESALWSFITTDNFETALLKAVNLGDDADTVGSITGQIAGVYYGYNQIPNRWTKNIAKKEWLKSISHKLINTINAKTKISIRSFNAVV